ncbi:predicted protein [Scheffersomyces stipitis CBS 6054]|uniref:Uncharacterized protein n=1 Tax=Scheffersomyces stipitis (strain ATCC 58785 / CBS 6054 / NBRC 10063 / NRRL Y-11545) TaxID=322104 RepID=A3GIB7_PICST|nr:predicted protein [Scheffersomyces stipitis CBS 6054]EAZ62962.2 predicted protein [Scheffersomyces stipitis CBS 6054]
MYVDLSASFPPNCRAFHYNNQTQLWVNTTCELDPFSDWDTAYSQTLYAFGTDDYFDFISLVGRQLAIEVVDIGGVPLEALKYIINERLGNETILRRDQDDSRPQYYFNEGGQSQSLGRTHNQGCDWQSFLPRATSYKSAVKGMICEKSAEKTHWIKSLWNIFSSASLGDSLTMSRLGTAFKESDAQHKCISRFLVVNKNMNSVSPGEADEPVILIGVLPRNKSGANCETATSAKEITRNIVSVLSVAGQKYMVAFCITLRGKNGWFGSNHWFGLLKFFPMVDDNNINYSRIACEESLL